MKFKEYLESLKGKRVAVVGAGISNTPLIDALLNAGIDTVICDRKNFDELDEQVRRFKARGAEFSLGGGYLESLNSDVIFRTPGLMPWHPALVKASRNGATLTSEMEVFLDVCPCQTIGVTGSDGKTTTTSLIAEMLRRDGRRRIHLGGNIGTPLLTSADDMGADDIAVLELSSFQLVSMKKSPDISVVTNLVPNHLDVHKDMDEYAAAKSNIFLHQGKSGRSVFNLDNNYTREYAKASPTDEILFFSRFQKPENGVYLDNGVIYEATHGSAEALMPADEIVLPGIHNVENFMAAFAAVRGLANRTAMIETARTFAGVPHRMEFIREVSGVKYYNDSIATSPTRTIAGLRSFSEKVILIAGGKGKGLSYRVLADEIITHVKTLIVTGAEADNIRSAVESSPKYTQGAPQIFNCDDCTDAVLTAAKSAQSGDIVILSPACTSFDRYKTFEERGNVFRKVVKGL